MKTNLKKRELHPSSGRLRTMSDRIVSTKDEDPIEWVSVSPSRAYSHVFSVSTFSAADAVVRSAASSSTSSSPLEPLALVSETRVSGAYLYPSSASSALPVTPGISSRRLADLQMILSPSPPSKKSPELLYPDFSPQLKDLSSPAFVDRFLSSLSSDWNVSEANSSPIARNTFTSPSTRFRESPQVTPGPKQISYDTDQILFYPISTAHQSRSNPFGIELPSTPCHTSGSHRASSRNIHISGLLSARGSMSPFTTASTLTPLSSPEQFDFLVQTSDCYPEATTRRVAEISHGYSTRSRFQSETKTRKNLGQLFDQEGVVAKPLITGVKTRKRTSSVSGSSVALVNTKKARISSPRSIDTSSSTEIQCLPAIFSCDIVADGPAVTILRKLPPDIQPSSQFPLFYRRFPASSYLQLEKSFLCSNSRHPGGLYNAPRDPFDLYTPRFVKGRGRTKVGLCPICVESRSRGGEGQKLWLSMKFSAFKCYHMQYSHGISAMTARPFSPPIAFRVSARRSPGKLERAHILEGKCHKCSKWIAVEGVKDVEVKVKEIFWWKHAAICHQGSTLPGEGDYYLEDHTYHRLMQLDA